jgi:Fur family ferric uptake transcriptional regulator
MSCNQILKEKGYRLTPQRLMVLAALHSVDTHISAEDIYAQVKAKYQYANISTIYRTLDLLKELKLIAEIDLDDGCVRYHLSEKGHHHHLVCSSCGKMINLPETALLKLSETLVRDYKFQADLKHLAVFGTCADCQV